MGDKRESKKKERKKKEKQTYILGIIGTRENFCLRISVTIYYAIVSGFSLLGHGYIASSLASQSTAMDMLSAPLTQRKKVGLYELVGLITVSKIFLIVQKG